MTWSYPGPSREKARSVHGARLGWEPFHDSCHPQIDAGWDNAYIHKKTILFEGTIDVHNWVCLKIGDAAKWYNLPVENEDKEQIIGEPQLEPEKGKSHQIANASCLVRQAACQVSAPGACWRMPCHRRATGGFVMGPKNIKEQGTS